MSILYEALLRAEQKGSKSGKATDVVSSGQEENSVVAGTASLHSFAAERPKSKPEAPSSAPRSASEDIPGRFPELPRQMVVSNTLESPEGVTELHGFRRLILPYQEETRLVFRADP